MTGTNEQEEPRSEPGPVRAQPGLKTHYVHLHEKCGLILAESLTGALEHTHGRSHAFADELDKWQQVLGDRPEAVLLASSCREMRYALLALVQGHYSHAFKSLRLVLELGLQSVYLSAHALELREWLASQKDTVWNEIMDADNGVFSLRFVRAFAPELEQHVKHYGSLAGKTYRECSECVHGNVARHIVLPTALAFDAGVFDLWHTKADIVAMVLSFVLAMRYLAELSEPALASVEQLVIDHLGHVPELRQRFGAPGGG